MPRRARAALLVTAVFLAGCGAEPLPEVMAPEPPDVPLPSGITAASEWRTGLGALEGNITIRAAYPTIEALGDATWEAVRRVNVPPESCGSDGPTHSIEPNDRSAFYLISLVFLQGDSGGTETLLALARGEGDSWSVTHAWFRTLSDEGVPETICAN
jgi:hypothetical protein